MIFLSAASNFMSILTLSSSILCLFLDTSLLNDLKISYIFYILYILYGIILRFQHGINQSIADKTVIWSCVFHTWIKEQLTYWMKTLISNEHWIKKKTQTFWSKMKSLWRFFFEIADTNVEFSCDFHYVITSLYFLTQLHLLFTSVIPS